VLIQVYGKLTKCQNCDKIWAFSHQKRVTTWFVYTYALVVHSFYRPNHRLIVVHSKCEGSMWILVSEPLLSEYQVDKTMYFMLIVREFNTSVHKL